MLSQGNDIRKEELLSKTFWPGACETGVRSLHEKETSSDNVLTDSSCWVRK